MEINNKLKVKNILNEGKHIHQLKLNIPNGD